MYISESVVKERRLSDELSDIVGNVVLVCDLTFNILVDSKRIGIVTKECFFAEILHPASVCCSLFENLSKIDSNNTL